MVAPWFWNSLPREACLALSICTFRKSVKTGLYTVERLLTLLHSLMLSSCLFLKLFYSFSPTMIFFVLLSVKLLGKVRSQPQLQQQQRLSSPTDCRLFVHGYLKCAVHWLLLQTRHSRAFLTYTFDHPFLHQATGHTMYSCPIAYHSFSHLLIIVQMAFQPSR